MIRVLLADDTEDIRLLMRLTLEQDGRFEIIGEAADGLEAIEMTKNTQPDAILLDLAMPRMDGFQAIPEIKKACPTVKIAILTAFDSSHTAKRAFSAGADRFLEKGAQLERIVAALVELCEDDDQQPQALNEAGE